jgi:hypothetical protein
MTKTEIKQTIHSLVDTVEDEVTLVQIQQMLESISEDSLTFSSLNDDERESINTGIDQLNKGKKIDYEDIKMKFPEWLRK